MASRTVVVCPTMALLRGSHLGCHDRAPLCLFSFPVIAHQSVSFTAKCVHGPQSVAVRCSVHRPHSPNVCEWSVQARITQVGQVDRASYELTTNARCCLPNPELP
jgi:hypothetical protein